MSADLFETIKVRNPDTSQPDRRERVLEIIVFLILIVPSMALSFFALNQDRLGFSLSAVASILRDLSLVSLILFFLWRNREQVVSIGWTFTNFWKEFLLGLILFSRSSPCPAAWRPRSTRPGFPSPQPLQRFSLRKDL